MERKIIFKQLKNCSTIYDHPSYCLFNGGGFRSMEKSTEKIVHYPKIQNFALKIAFLPSNRLLVEDSVRRYHIVSLDDGIVLKTAETPRGRSLASLRNFAVSPDSSVAYDTWLIKGKSYLVRINLSNLRCESIPYTPTLNYMRDILCLSTQHLLLLETKNQEIDGEGRTVNQITRISIDGDGITSNCEKTWISPPHGGAFCLHDAEVIEHDLHRTVWQTGERIDLLEHSDFQWPENFHPLARIYDAQHDTIQLVDSTQNIYVDCAQKKVVARYFTQKPGFVGARIGNRFWIGTDCGIASVDFPYIEDAE